MSDRSRLRREDRAIQALQRQGRTRAEIRAELSKGLGLGGGPVRRSNARLTALRAEALPVVFGGKTVTHAQAQAIAAAVGDGRAAATAARQASKSGVRVGRDFILKQRRQTGDPNNLRTRPIHIRDPQAKGRKYLYQAVGRRIDGTEVFLNFTSEGVPLTRSELNELIHDTLRKNWSEGSEADAAAPKGTAPNDLPPGQGTLLARSVIEP